jgi:geranylgeranyl pyrophosphate synthase
MMYEGPRRSAAVRVATPESRERRRELTGLLNGRELANGRLERAVELLDKAGSRGWTLRLAERHLERAPAQLEGCSLDGGVASDLRDVAMSVTSRDF